MLAIKNGATHICNEPLGGAPFLGLASPASWRWLSLRQYRQLLGYLWSDIFPALTRLM
jgi:hypothetical protein